MFSHPKRTDSAPTRNHLLAASAAAEAGAINRSDFVWANAAAKCYLLTRSSPTCAETAYMTMNPRDSVLIQRNAIEMLDLERMLDEAQRAQMTDSLVSNFEEDAASEWTVNRKIRDTQEVHVPAAMVAVLSNLHDSCVRTIINPFYAVEVRDSEPLQVLHYGVGGHYVPHVDAETLYKDDIGLDMWEKTLDRDLSVVYFMNDDFSGGELFFPALDLVIAPAAGTLVCFPSDHHYVHGVKPVTAGHRYTMVTWLRTRGMPTVDEINEMAMQEYESRWPQQIEQPPRLAKGAGIKKS